MTKLAALVVLAAVASAPAPALAKPRPALRIVFSANRTGTAQLYAVMPATGAASQLTFGDEASVEPIPSPDGRLVAFVRAGWVWVARADGTRARRLDAGSAPAWARDSRRVLYASAGGIREIGIDGSRVRVLTRDAEDRSASLSPDGRRLLVLRNQTLFIVHARVEKKVAPGVTAAAWEPHGRSIAYAHGGQIVLARPDGSRRRTIATGDQPAWSPDGRRLAFTNAGIGFVDVSTGVVVELTHDFPYALPFSRHPAWSPNGDAIAFEYGIGQTSLRVVTTTGVVRDLPGAGISSAPRWTRPPAATRYRGVEPLARAGTNELAALGAIREIAADGDRIAFTTCGDIGVWRPGGAVTILREEIPLCWPSSTRTFSLALAGTRVAYGLDEGGIQVHGWLEIKPLDGSRGATIQAAGRNCCRGNPFEPPIGQVLGDGGLLVFSSWRADVPSAGITSESLWRFEDGNGTCPKEPGPCRLIATGAGTFVPLSVDAGRIAVRRADGTLELLDADGRRLLELSFPAGEVLAAELSGRDLVVLTPTRLLVYDTATAVLTRELRTATVDAGGFCGYSQRCGPTPALRLEDAALGLAAYVLRGEVHVVRLSDGADRVLASGTAARFGDTGLFYAYRVADRRPGRIRFVPLADLF